MEKLIVFRKFMLSIKKFFSKKVTLSGNLELNVTQLVLFGVGFLAGVYICLSWVILEIPESFAINLTLFIWILLYGLIRIILFKEKERRKEVDFNLRLFFEIFFYYLGGIFGLIVGLVILFLIVLGFFIFHLFELISPFGLFFWNGLSNLVHLIPVEIWIILGSIVIPFILFWIISGQKTKKEMKDINPKSKKSKNNNLK